MEDGLTGSPGPAPRSTSLVDTGSGPRCHANTQGTVPPQQGLYPDDPRLEVRPFIPPGALRVLDVGCGRGGFGLTLRDVLGPHAVILGMDAVEENVRSAEKEHGYDEVYLGYFPGRFDGSDPSFVLITFFDVLEHLNDPWSVLAQAVDLLSPGGRIVAVIPSIQAWTVVRDLLRGRWDYTDTGTLDRTHIRFFTKSTMIELLEGAGLEVVECKGVNSLKPRKRPVRGYFNRRLIHSMKWLPALVPDSQWLQFVLVGKKPTD